MRLIQKEEAKKKKRVHLVPLFFVEHLALTLPCFLLLPPTRPRPPSRKLIHRQKCGGPADLPDPTPASSFCLRH